MNSRIVTVVLGFAVSTMLSACSFLPASAEPELGAALASADGYAEDSITVSGVSFGIGDATLQAEADDVVARAVQHLQSNPDSRVLIEGHTDRVGSESLNQKLSEKRAMAVVTALREHGISADRMTAVGYGETQPIADNSTPEGRSENRRVEIHFAR